MERQLTEAQINQLDLIKITGDLIAYYESKGYIEYYERVLRYMNETQRKELYKQTYHQNK